MRYSIFCEFDWSESVLLQLAFHFKRRAWDCRLERMTLSVLCLSSSYAWISVALSSNWYYLILMKLQLSKVAHRCLGFSSSILKEQSGWLYAWGSGACTSLCQYVCRTSGQPRPLILSLLCSGSFMQGGRPDSEIKFGPVSLWSVQHLAPYNPLWRGWAAWT